MAANSQELRSLRGFLKSIEDVEYRKAFANGHTPLFFGDMIPAIDQLVIPSYNPNNPELETEYLSQKDKLLSRFVIDFVLSRENELREALRVYDQENT